MTFHITLCVTDISIIEIKPGRPNFILGLEKTMGNLTLNLQGLNYGTIS